jgi:ribosome biogenesis GTPase
MTKSPSASSAPVTVDGRIVRAQSGFFVVDTPHGQVTAVLKGTMRRERQSGGLAALGDRVRVALLARPEGAAGLLEGTVIEVLPRDTALVRRAPGPRGAWAQDVVVANIERLVPVFAARQPEPKLRMLDRFLALAEIDHIHSVIVINKADLGISDALAAAVAEYERIGYPVICASAHSGEGIGALRAELAGHLSAVVGPSGVGKSSLLNALEPGLGLAVGTVSEAVGKGRHTTRVGQLHALTGGGMVADTPGLREIGLWEVDPGELEFAFVEFQPFLHHCRFPDCTHTHEPGCAVRQAVADGQVSAARFASYAALLTGEPER